MFRAVTLDKTTDLRGVKLLDLVSEENRDFSGRLLLKGTDWRKATYDETTQIGSDPTAIDRKLLKLIIDDAKLEKEAWAQDIAAEAERCLKQLIKDPDFQWYQTLLESIDPANQLQTGLLFEKATMQL